MILDEEYSVSQLSPGDYRYVKWWDDGPVLRAERIKSDKSGETSTST